MHIPSAASVAQELVHERPLERLNGEFKRRTDHNASGMMNGMETRVGREKKAKVAVTVAPEVLEQVRAAVAAGRARSVSAYVEHAVVAQLAAEADFDTMLTEMLAASGGEPTSQERAEARRLLSGAA